MRNSVDPASSPLTALCIMSSSVTTRRTYRLRCNSDVRQRLTRIANSHVRNPPAGSYAASARYARKSASCVTSSASCRLPSMRVAKRRQGCKCRSTSIVNARGSPSRTRRTSIASVMLPASTLANAGSVTSARCVAAARSREHQPHRQNRRSSS